MTRGKRRILEEVLRWASYATPQAGIEGALAMHWCDDLTDSQADVNNVQRLLAEIRNQGYSVSEDDAACGCGCEGDFEMTYFCIGSWHPTDVIRRYGTGHVLDDECGECGEPVIPVYRVRQ